jgi:transposase-like protein
MICPACKSVTWRTYAQVMATDKFVCERCGKPLPFDTEAWRRQVFKPHQMSLDERINEKGRRLSAKEEVSLLEV